MILSCCCTLLAAATLPDSLEFRVLGPSSTRPVHELLSHSYVASADGQLRLQYRRRFVRWLLSRERSVQLGIVERETSLLIGYVCALGCTLHSAREESESVEVTLLCVRREWRRLGLTKALLLELRRRVLACGVQCAIFTGATSRGAALLRVPCYHRPLRPLLLLRSGFWQLPKGDDAKCLVMRAAATHRASRLPRLRRMRMHDVNACQQLLLESSRRFDLGVAPSVAEFCSRFLDCPASHSFVLSARDFPTAFVSFMLVPLRTPKGCITQAVLHGLAIADESQVGNILASTLICARRCGAAVFNALPLGQCTSDVLASLGFGIGDGVTFIYAEVSPSAELSSIGKLVRDGGKRHLSPDKVAWLPLG